MDFKRLLIGAGIILVVVVLAVIFHGSKANVACFADNGSKIYVGLSPSQCSTIKFSCDTDKEYFSDSCGCGCKPKEHDSNESLPGKLVPTYCSNESREGDICTQEYSPVCGWYDPDVVKCIRYPCAETASNSCTACHNSNVLYYTQGECPMSSSPERA